MIFAEGYSFVPAMGLRYAVPVGWVDASGDSFNTGSTILLVRNDYAASIGVCELNLDAMARVRLQKEGARVLALLGENLAASNKEKRVLSTALLRNIGTRETYSFEHVHLETGDTVLVDVMVVGGRAVELTGRIAGGVQGIVTRTEMRAVQDAFIERLGW